MGKEYRSVKPSLLTSEALYLYQIIWGYFVELQISRESLHAGPEVDFCLNSVRVGLLLDVILCPLQHRFKLMDLGDLKLITKGG